MKDPFGGNSKTLLAMFRYAYYDTVVLIAAWTLQLSAINLPPAQDLDKGSTQGLVLPINSTQSPNISSSITDYPNYSCSGGSSPGDSIDWTSCLDAANRLLAGHTSGRTILSFLDRRSQVVAFQPDIDLPYLSMSCKSFFGCEVKYAKNVL